MVMPMDYFFGKRGQLAIVTAFFNDVSGILSKTKPHLNRGDAEK